MSVELSKFEQHPLIAEAIQKASLYGVRVRFEHHMHNNALEIICLSETKAHRAMLRERELVVLGESLIAERINTMVKQFNNSDASRIATLESELRTYKEVVTNLAFQLEMKEGRAHNTENINAIRSLALEQASNFVMDWGIPKSGGDLVELCGRIKSLHETKDVAIKRAMAAIDIVFKDKK
jgi:hypothetical protein